LKPDKTTKDEYQRISIQTTDKKAKKVYVHRLVLLAFVGPPPNEKDQVDHIDHDRKNNHISNLRWISASKNCLRRNSSGRAINVEKQYMWFDGQRAYFDVRDLARCPDPTKAQCIEFQQYIQRLVQEDQWIIDGEEWRTLPNGIQVSSHGRIMTDGFKTFGTARNNGGVAFKDIFVHELVTKAFHGPGGDDMEILHINHDRMDNRACNLKWIPKSERGNHLKTRSTVAIIRQDPLTKEVVEFESITAGVKSITPSNAAAEDVVRIRKAVEACLKSNKKKADNQKSSQSQGYNWRYKINP
jgi:hypothetical protein